MYKSRALNNNNNNNHNNNNNNWRGITFAAEKTNAADTHTQHTHSMTPSITIPLIAKWQLR